MSELVKKLSEIQRKLKAPKGQFNSYGKYAYRNCEDILEALKPLLKDVILTITDEVVLIGDRFYIKATAQITDGDSTISVSAFARECDSRKGMDDAMLTGSTSSYARKYALNGLFCIDDNRDPDVTTIEDEKIDKLKLHQEKVREHFLSVVAIKENIAPPGQDRDADIGYAMEAWFEIPLNDRRILALAPSKGGIFTTAERGVVCGEEFTAEYRRRVKEGLEENQKPEE